MKNLSILLALLTISGSSAVSRASCRWQLAPKFQMVPNDHRSSGFERLSGQFTEARSASTATGPVETLEIRPEQMDNYFTSLNVETTRTQSTVQIKATSRGNTIIIADLPSGKLLGSVGKSLLYSVDGPAPRYLAISPLSGARREVPVINGLGLLVESTVVHVVIWKNYIRSIRLPFVPELVAVSFLRGETNLVVKTSDNQLLHVQEVDGKIRTHELLPAGSPKVMNLRLHDVTGREYTETFVDQGAGDVTAKYADIDVTVTYTAGGFDHRTRLSTVEHVGR